MEYKLVWLVSGCDFCLIIFIREFVEGVFGLVFEGVGNMFENIYFILSFLLFLFCELYLVCERL